MIITAAERLVARSVDPLPSHVWFQDMADFAAAVEGLLDQGLIEEGVSQQFATDHPDPDLP